jgi:hypothetical protein
MEICPKIEGKNWSEKFRAEMEIHQIGSSEEKSCPGHRS